MAYAELETAYWWTPLTHSSRTRAQAQRRMHAVLAEPGGTQTYSRPLTRTWIKPSAPRVSSCAKRHTDGGLSCVAVSVSASLCGRRYAWLRSVQARLCGCAACAHGSACSSVDACKANGIVPWPNFVSSICVRHTHTPNHLRLGSALTFRSQCAMGCPCSSHSASYPYRANS
jgi:hypothetical protein